MSHWTPPALGFVPGSPPPLSPPLAPSSGSSCAYSSLSQEETEPEGTSRLLVDTQKLQVMSGWREIPVVGLVPAPRHVSSFTLVDGQDRAILLFGYTAKSTLLNDMFVFLYIIISPPCFWLIFSFIHSFIFIFSQI